MTTEEKIAVMQAYIEGKTIMKKKYTETSWDFETLATPSWDWNTYTYKVYEAPEIRAFYDAEEAVKAIQKNGMLLINKENRNFYAIGSVDNEVCVGINGYFTMYCFEKALKTFNFANGEPFGVTIENI